MGDSMMSPTGAVTARRVLIGLCALATVLVVSLLSMPYLMPVGVERLFVGKVLETVLRRPVQVSGDASFSIIPNIRLSARDVVITNLHLKNQPVLADIANLNVEINLRALLSSTLDITQLKIDRPILRLSRNLEGQSNWQVHGADSSNNALIEPDFNWGWWRGLSVERVQVRDGRLVYDDRRSGRRIIGEDANFQARMSDATGAADGLSISGSIDINGELVNLRFDMGSMKRLMTGGRLPLDIEISALPVLARYQGTLASRQHIVTEGLISLNVPNLRQFQNWLGHVFSRPVGGGLTWTSGFTANAERVMFENMRLNLDSGQYTGALHFESESGGHVLDGKIVASNLSVAPFVDLLSDSWWFDGVKGAIHLNWRQLSFDDLRFGKGALITTFYPDAHKVVLNLSELSMHNGLAKGVMKITNREGMTSLDGRFDLSRVSAGTLLTEWRSTTPLTGRTNLRLEMLSVGSSYNELLAALHGAGEFNIAEGAVFNADLAKYLNIDDQLKLNFSQLVGSFSIDQGIVSGRDFLLKSKKLSLIGDGIVDLSRNEINIHLQSLVRENATRKNESPRVRPFRMQGSLSDIKIFNEDK